MPTLLSVIAAKSATTMPLPAAYQLLCQQLQAAGIELHIQRKRVKNINFRLKPNLLMVSAPRQLSDDYLAAAIERRLQWVLAQHPLIVAQQQNRLNRPLDSCQQAVPLWGELQPYVMGEQQRLRYYRDALTEVLPELFAKWQPIVGQSAGEYRIKKMKTRWGSCNVKARRVWLSVYLPAYPMACTEYVIVHELCHLHHANHSAAFWREVQRAMPDYRRWHQLLAGREESDKSID